MAGAPVSGERGESLRPCDAGDGDAGGQLYCRCLHGGDGVAAGSDGCEPAFVGEEPVPDACGRVRPAVRGGGGVDQYAAEVFARASLVCLEEPAGSSFGARGGLREYREYGFSLILLCYE